MSAGSKLYIVDFNSEADPFLSLFKYPNPTQFLMVADQTLLDYVCSELAGQLESHPTVRSKSSLTLNDIECAANSLGWDSSHPPSLGPVDGSESSPLSRSQIHEMWVQPPRSSGKPDVIIPQIYMYHQQDWRPTVHEDDTSQSTVSGASFEGASILPDGIREFIRQVEHLYDQDDENALQAQREILESLASSEHMPICFPHLVKFAVDKIRTSYRKNGDIVIKLLELLEHILRNRYFDLTGNASSGIFDLLVGCFVMLVTDVNLLSIGDEDQSMMSSRIRDESVRLFRALVESKIGKFHSVALIGDLMDVHLIPLISVIKTRLKNRHITADIRSRLEDVLRSTNALMRELMLVNESRLSTSNRMSYVGYVTLIILSTV